MIAGQTAYPNRCAGNQMPMSTQSVPHLREPTVPDTKKTEPATRPASTGSSTFAGTGEPAVNDSVSLPLSDRPLLPGESSDPAVQHLLAEKQAHQMNRDAIDPPVDQDALKAVDERIAEVDKRLADLGFQQQSQADRKAEQEKAAGAAQK